MKRNQFVPIQVGIFDHFEDGRLPPILWCILTIILHQLDYETGFWRGSAEKVAVAWCHKIGKRTLQLALKQLCDKGYLKSFHKRGHRGNYLVAVHKYPIRFGPEKGCMLDAAATPDPEHPVYVQDSRQEDSGGAHAPRNSATGAHRLAVRGESEFLA